ncbi:hypothetical protein B4Q13_18600, partial [Lacticaseibacillus rhamnosus]
MRPSGENPTEYTLTKGAQIAENPDTLHALRELKQIKTTHVANLSRFFVGPLIQTQRLARRNQFRLIAIDREIARIHFRGDDLRTADHTTDDLVSALNDARSAGDDRVILDLRNDAGGLRDQAISVASEFVGSGDILVQQDAHGQRESFPA